MLCCVELCGGPMSSGSRPSPTRSSNARRVRSCLSATQSPKWRMQMGKSPVRYCRLPWSPPTPLPPQPPPPATQSAMIPHAAGPDDSDPGEHRHGGQDPPAGISRAVSSSRAVIDVAVPHRRQRDHLPTTIHRTPSRRPQAALRVRGHVVHAEPGRDHKGGCTPTGEQSTDASSMANRNALASLATALVRVASFAGVTKRRNRRKARSAFSGAPDPRK